MKPNYVDVILRSTPYTDQRVYQVNDVEANFSLSIGNKKHPSRHTTLWRDVYVCIIQLMQ